VTPTVTPPVGHVTGALTITTTGDASIPASNLQFRVDTVAGTGQALTASYSTDNGATWTAATPDVPGNPTQFALMTIGGSTVSAKIGTVATNAVGDIHTVTMTTGEVSQASYSTDGGTTWAAAAADTAAATPGSFVLGASGFKAQIETNSNQHRHKYI